MFFILQAYFIFVCEIVKAYKISVTIWIKRNFLHDLSSTL